MFQRKGGRQRISLGRAVETTSAAVQSDVQEDLSGTYKGKIEFPGQSLESDADIKIDGNRFTLKTADGNTLEGRISAVTNRGYTAVALMFSGKSVSVRLTRTGTGFRMRSIPGQPKLLIQACDCDSCRDPVRCNCC
jgi:hypothetical protein